MGSALEHVSCTYDAHSRLLLKSLTVVQVMIWCFSVMEQQEHTLHCTALAGQLGANSRKACVGGSPLILPAQSTGS